MSKRKRHNSLSERIPENQINGLTECLNEESSVEPDIEQPAESINKKSLTIEDGKIDIENSNENIDPVTTSNETPNEVKCLAKDITRSDNFNIRRKSNRILSLKKSIVPNSLQNGGLPNSTDDSTSVQQQGNGTSNCEPTSNANIATDTTKANQTSTVDVSISSSFTSSSVQSQASNQTNQNKCITNNSAPSVPAPGKSLRKIQVWTEDDTRWFFEALCEHGKDFPHIQAYIAARYEKKGIPSDMIKNYEQVRHYYYRMWHKISQMLNISNVVEKGIQEIYGLINYGEIWKKFGSKFDAKLNTNLQQLVDYGYTVFKVKGKSVRVRTPICNALKKIHNINNKAIHKPSTPAAIPKEITVELLPATNADWIHVHSLAQNPRLRTKLTMQHRLSSLISYLERRWNIVESEETTANELQGPNLCDKNNCVALRPKKSYAIRLKPQISEKLTESVKLKSTSNSISMNSYRSTTHGNAQIDLSLSSYLKNLLLEDSTLNDGKKSKIRKSSKKTIQTEAANNSTAQQAEGKDKSTENEVEKGKLPNTMNQTIDLLKMFDSLNEEMDVSKNKPTSGQADKSSLDSFEMELPESNEMEDRDFMRLPPAHTTLAQWLAGGLPSTLGSEKEDDVIEEETESGQSVNSSPNQSSLPSELKNKKRRGSMEAGSNVLVNLLTAKQARLGWMFEDVQSVSIGELYLLFSCPTKIVLEYSWENKVDKKEQHCESMLSTELGKSIDKAAESEFDPIKESSKQISPVKSLLQKLLIAANVTLSNMKKPIATNSTNSQSASCNTGDSTLPSNGQGNKPIRKRISKKVSPTLLSNVIRDTILSDSPTKPPSQIDNQNANEENVTATSSTNKDATKEIAFEEKEFAVPKMPAPRSNQSLAVKSSKYRGTTPDPMEVEQALNELKTQKYRRQRRPLPKPYMYNLQNKMMPQKMRSALLVIPASHITSAEGKTSPQILLTDLLKSHIPQASISLSSSPSNTSLTVTPIPSNQSNEQHPLSATSSVVIPIQVETKTVPKDISSQKESPIQQPSDDNKSSITTITIASKSSTEIGENLPSTFKESNLASILSQDAKAKNEDNPGINFGAKQPLPSHSSLPLTSQVVTPFAGDVVVPSEQLSSIGLAKPSTADVLTQSQLAWLNNVNDLSLGSLISACDIATNEELNMNQKTNESMLPHINSDIETHMNSMANDNSIDLMAKFADLAAQITADTKNI